MVAVITALRSGLRLALALLGELLVLGGAVVGLFAAWLYWGQSPLPTAAQLQTNHRIQHAFRTGTTVPAGVVALARIPALGASWQYPAYEGTGSAQFSKGLADDIRVGDPIVVDTAAAEYVYKVTGTLRTDPADAAVLRPDQGRGADPSPRLVTVTTCMPRYGSSGRFIVFGRLVSTVKEPVQ